MDGFASGQYQRILLRRKSEDLIDAQEDARRSVPHIESHMARLVEVRDEMTCALGRKPKERKRHIWKFEWSGITATDRGAGICVW